MIANQLTESPLLRHPKPWWLPVLSLAVTLYGILVLHWDLKPVVFMFWWEVILIVASALLRTLFALDGRPYFENFGQRIFLLLGGAVMGSAFIMFSVAFTIGAFTGNDYSALAGIADETRVMTAGYVLGLVIHYFGNGSFRKASPAAELMRSFAHLLVLMAFLQALTMHLIPKYPQLDQAVWVAVALVVLKFIVDMLFARIGKPLRDALAARPDEIQPL